MAWGAGPSMGVDDWVRRLEANDPSLASITVLRARRFGTPEVVALCAALSGNSTLEDLQASGRALEAPALRALATMLAANQTLRSLCAGDASFGDSGAVLLSEGLRSNHTLQLLDLSSRGVGPVGALALSQAITCQQGGGPMAASAAAVTDTSDSGPGEGAPVAENGNREPGAHGAGSLPTGIQRLDLSLNPLGCRGASALAPCIAGLHSLNLSGCDIGAEGSRALGAAAGYSSASGRRLRTLDLSSNPLGPAGGQALADGFASVRALGPHQRPACLEELILADTAVGDAAVEALASALASVSVSTTRASVSASVCDIICNSTSVSVSTSVSASLQKLDLSRCALQGLSAAAAVRQVGGLRILTVAGNSLSPAAVVELAATIASTGCLQELDLSKSTVPLTAEALAALASACSLEKLSLFAGAIGDAGCAEVSAAVRQGAWPLMRQLDLSGCELSTAAVAELFLALAAGAMPKLQVLLLGANPAVEEPESFEVVAAPLQRARPALDLVWRASGGFETQ